MLKKTRIAVAVIVWTLITLLFVGIGQDWWGWLAKIQFLPTVMQITAGALGLNLAVLAGLILITLLAGRIYCSVICPLGIFQDGVLWIHRTLHIKTHKPKPNGHKNFLTFKYKKEKKILRYGIWVLYVAAMIAGMQVVVALLAPYSAYGRIVRSVAQYFCTGAFGGPAAPAQNALAVVGGVTFVIIGVLAWVTGRGWCNSICPVGTTLSFFSRFAVWAPRIDKDKCVTCHRCEKACRTHCIDLKTKEVDLSRCVDCYECIDICPKGALAVRTKSRKSGKTAGEPKQPAESGQAGRRAFLQGAAMAITGAAAATIASQTDALAQNMKVDGGLAPVEAKKKPERTERITPAGSRSPRMFYSKCTACQLCVAACPNGVLRPSTDLDRFMQPEMSYEKGWCRPECTACSDVCPAGAILPVAKEEKSSIHIGLAHINTDLCIIDRDDVNCGNCATHCPSGAILMVQQEGSEHRKPSVVEDKCIGCGACEFVCPARPISAITVNGRHDHIKD